MKKQTERELEKKAKEKAEKREGKKKPLDKPDVRKPTAKKWKGKDWFNVLSPKMFGEKKIAETPCTDPKTLINRNIEVSLGELTGQPARHQMKLVFKIVKTDGNNAFTRFNGYIILKEFLMRNVRKHSQKVTLVQYFDTKDGWRLQITATTILNRNTDANIQRKMRHFVEETILKTTRRSDIDDFVRALIAGNIQRSIKKEGSKIYPVKLAEIEKVEVIRTGEGK